MQIRGVEIVDTFAEAFPMWFARLVITAENEYWARVAAQCAVGFAASVIGCPCEAGLERVLPAEETPDRRPGQAVLLFAMSPEALEKELLARIGQMILPAPSSACYNGVDGEIQIATGAKLRYFGDGFQASKVIGERRFWRVPVMDGEFVVEESFGAKKGVGGGNFLILARNQRAGLEAAAAAAEAITSVPGVIAPFPGGVCRSGSKIGSRYAGLRASTNEAFCPTLRGRVESHLPGTVGAVYEIVLDGMDELAVRMATRAGVEAACIPGVVQITAGNYGGNLGPYHFHLHDILDGGSHAI
jgi:formylmethanofuran--tetrahydromethanopterin N-formyltransferase